MFNTLALLYFKSSLVLCTVKAVRSFVLLKQLGLLNAFVYEPFCLGTRCLHLKF
uniref:Uncharacterized protein n=1 Tax=Meloidogyne enterolobii TaxID=390850 RepID=A0A6V7UT74_MELEN|nr:unnamed protein product [Meloidogyne enterolobii]